VSWWRQLSRGVQALTRSSAADRDIADEVRHYMDQAAAELQAGGVPPEEARRLTQASMGNATSLAERVRESGWEHFATTLVADLRHATRRLRHAPGFTIVCAATLALGIGASTAIVSAVYPILFEPLPYPNPRQIVMISDVGASGASLETTFGTYLELSQRSRSFESLASMKPWQPVMVGPAEPERLEGQRVSAQYFRALGVRPALGRDFDAADDTPGGPRVAIVGDGLWRRRLGADPTIVGREIRLDDLAYVVVGVMPRGFENVPAASAEIWSPLQYTTVLRADAREWGHHLRMLGRLRTSVAANQSRQELNRIARTPEETFPRVPWAFLERGLIVRSLQDEVTQAVRPLLLAVLGAVALVLAIAAVNVTNVQLARGAQRRGEFAMRAALGAGRGRLIRQLLTESLLLAAIGGVLGVAVSEAGVRALVALAPPALPRISAIHVSGVALAFAFVVTTLLGLVVGVAPAMAVRRDDLQPGLLHASQRTAGGQARTRVALVIAEVALALVLLVSAGLIMRSLERLFAVPIGFDPGHLLTMKVQAVGHAYDSDTARHLLFARVLEEVRRVPGVTAAAFTSQLPLSGDVDGYGVHFENDRDLKDVGSALRYAITPEYFEAMRLPLRGGRLLDAHDTAAGQAAVVINESFARRRFGAADPSGRRLRFGPDQGPWFTIVGVVGDVKQTSLALANADAIYVTSEQWHWVDPAMSLVVRSGGDPLALTASVRTAVWSVDKDQAITRVASMDQLLARSEADRRFASTLFEVFGVVALLLATIGVYGVLAGSVTERTREIGVRVALGASRADVLTFVVREGMIVTGLGIALGLAGAAAASQALVTLLFGVSRLDPVTYLGVVAILIVASAVASSVPAWRAVRVDPATTLRAE
jgi:putative ABC transport system permease protein